MLCYIKVSYETANGMPIGKESAVIMLHIKECIYHICIIKQVRIVLKLYSMLPLDAIHCSWIDYFPNKPDFGMKI